VRRRTLWLAIVRNKAFKETLTMEMRKMKITEGALVWG
jgi:hypothetical protein